jgi:5-formyltetrahydrofolate cyclo-ligase
MYKTVLCFLSMQQEIDTDPLLNAALYSAKAVFVPQLVDERLCFIQINDTNGPWRSGIYGIREPAADGAPLCPKDFPALILMPGLAFDRAGNRLGRGKGYYDKFCTELDALHLEYRPVGLCLSTQIVSYVPTEPHDKSVDGVLAGAKGFLQKQSTPSYL